MSVKGRLRVVHQVAYEIFIGPVAPGKLVLHRPVCDRRCFNPEHLNKGSRQDVKRRQVKGTETWNAKLNPEKVRKIRALVRDFHRPIKAVAEEFSVDPSTVKKILDKEIWRHVR